MKHDRCEVKRMNLKAGQRRASSDAGQRNLIGQRPGFTQETITTH